MFYNAEEYIEKLDHSFTHDHEIAALMGASPDSDGGGCHSDNMNKIELGDDRRSKKTGRLFPTSNKPNPMPKDLAFMFQMCTPQFSTGQHVYIYTYIYIYIYIYIYAYLSLCLSLSLSLYIYIHIVV